jgi:hypothetical protein
MVLLLPRSPIPTLGESFDPLWKQSFWLLPLMPLFHRSRVCRRLSFENSILVELCRRVMGNILHLQELAAIISPSEKELVIFVP